MPSQYFESYLRALNSYDLYYVLSLIDQLVLLDRRELLVGITDGVGGCRERWLIHRQLSLLMVYSCFSSCFLLLSSR